MSKILAFQTDPLISLKKDGDTSLFLAAYLNSKGYQIFCYEPKDLSYKSNLGPLAKGFFLEVKDLGKELAYEKISPFLELPLTEARAVFIRQDPPFDLNYLLSSQILSLLPPEILVLNKPELLRDHIEKSLPYFLAQKLNDFSFIAPSIISNNFQDIKNFLAEEKEIILKPLYGFGGAGVVKVTHEKEISTYMKDENTTLIAQKFLPEVYQGDRRLLVYDKKILGLLKRIPINGSYLTNSFWGSEILLGELEVQKEIFYKKIIEALPDGLFFAGLDFIGDYLTEVNITSPGLLYKFKLLAGDMALEPFFQNLIKKLEKA